MHKYPKVVLIGAGNVATQFGLSLKSLDVEVVQVYSHTQASAKKLAKKLRTTFTTEIAQLNSSADFYILAVKDDAIEEVLAQINFQPAFILHTSGSVSSTVFSPKFKKYGVLYPLQTFSVSRKVNITKVPLFVEANTKANLQVIINFVSLLSPYVYKIDSETRKALHVAAVFACNFSNHMYVIAEAILKNHSIPFEVLHPLLMETTKKAIERSPARMQTGPAVRKDKKIMEEHRTFLKNEEDFKKIYTLVSKSIMDFSK